MSKIKDDLRTGHKYIDHTGNISVYKAFDDSLFQLQSLDISKLKRLGNERYLSDKWTVREILQHISDAGRILAAHALGLSRYGDARVISFDERTMAPAGNANTKRIEQLLCEMETVRRSTISLYKGFPDEGLLKSCINWNDSMSILDMVFYITWLQAYYLKIIEEKYYPLLN